jgi:hypothetical protein
MEVHDRGIDGDGPADRIDGFGELAALHLHHAQQVQRIDVVRLRLENRAVEFFGLSESSLMLVSQRGAQDLQCLVGVHALSLRRAAARMNPRSVAREP